jgi:hydrogenase maturation factor
MNLIYAQVVEVYSEDDALMGKVTHWGVSRDVPLRLVPDARPGDTVLLCDGVAIGKVGDTIKQPSMKGVSHVFGCSRQSSAD